MAEVKPALFNRAITTLHYLVIPGISAYMHPHTTADKYTPMASLCACVSLCPDFLWLCSRPNDVAGIHPQEIYNQNGQEFLVKYPLSCVSMEF